MAKSLLLSRLIKVVIRRCPGIPSFSVPTPRCRLMASTCSFLQSRPLMSSAQWKTCTEAFSIHILFLISQTQLFIHLNFISDPRVSFLVLNLSRNVSVRGGRVQPFKRRHRPRNRLATKRRSTRSCLTNTDYIFILNGRVRTTGQPLGLVREPKGLTNLDNPSTTLRVATTFPEAAVIED